MSEEEVIEETEVETTEEVVEETQSEESTEEDGLFDSEETQSEEYERPDWLDKRFKTEEELSKSFTELEKKFHEKHEVPEEYKYEDSLKEFGVVVHDEDELQEYFSDAKAEGFSQKQMDWMIAKLGSQNMSLLQNYGPARDSALAKDTLEKEWGDNYTSRIQAIGTFAKGEYPEAVWKAIAHDADAVKWAGSQMASKRGSNPVDTSGASSSGSMSKDAVRSLTGDPKYKQEGAAGDEFRAYVRQQFDLTFPENE